MEILRDGALALVGPRLWTNSERTRPKTTVGEQLNSHVAYKGPPPQPCYPKQGRGKMAPGRGLGWCRAPSMPGALPQRQFMDANGPGRGGFVRRLVPSSWAARRLRNRRRAFPAPL